MIFKGGIKIPKATQTTGKEGELRVIGELLKRGFQVYTPLVDIGGIDCIIQTDKVYKEGLVSGYRKSDVEILTFLNASRDKLKFEMQGYPYKMVIISAMTDQ